jgi:hypothetical protein
VSTVARRPGSAGVSLLHVRLSAGYGSAGVSHTGASIVHAEVQICGPDLVSTVTAHREAKRSADSVGLGRGDKETRTATEEESRQDRGE